MGTHNAIKTARLARRLRQVDLAKKARVHQTTLSDYETGRIIQPRPKTLKRLAKALGVEPESLLSDGA